MNEDNTYNGWTNRATWNVVLWVANDQRVYDVWRKWCWQSWDAATVKMFIYYIWPDGLTPDGDRLAEANHTEIAKAWNEDRKEDQ